MVISRVLLTIIVTTDLRDSIGDQICGVEADAELADDRFWRDAFAAVAFLHLGQFFDENLRP